MFNYEVDFLLKRKWGAATWIFIVNRYLLIGKIIFQAIPFGPQVGISRFWMRFLLIVSADVSFWAWLWRIYLLNSRIAAVTTWQWTSSPFSSMPLCRSSLSQVWTFNSDRTWPNSSQIAWHSVQHPAHFRTHSARFTSVYRVLVAGIHEPVCFRN